MTTGKTIALTRWTFVGKVMSLFFNVLSRFFHSFPSKEQVSYNFMAAVTIHSDFGAQENKVWHCFHCFPICLHEVMGLDAMILVFWMLSFKSTFSLSSFTFIKRIFSSSSLSAIRVVSPACGDGGGLVAKPCLTLYDPMDCSLPGPPVHGILQARILEWVAHSRGSS